MKTTIIQKNGFNVTQLTSNEPIIWDTQSAMDVILGASYQTDSHHFIINKEAFTDDFFQLKTKLAGEILQKLVNYQIKLAIIGDFSIYKSSALKDFIYECNQGKDVYFLPTVKEALKKFTN